jgi:mannitol/fructose-specific phosphotransferase system IIA component (Ntr-type)
MNLKDLLTPESVLLSIEPGPKETMIERLVAALPLEGDDDHRQKVYEAVLERENVMSTGIGRGVAIPHAKTDEVAGLMAAVGISREPVPFDSIDGKPVSVFFLIVSNSRTSSPHIKALSLISRVLNDGARKSALMEATSVEEVMEALDVSDDG